MNSIKNLHQEVQKCVEIPNLTANNTRQELADYIKIKITEIKTYLSHDNTTTYKDVLQLLVELRLAIDVVDRRNEIINDLIKDDTLSSEVDKNEICSLTSEFFKKNVFDIINRIVKQPIATTLFNSADQIFKDIKSSQNFSKQVFDEAERM